MCHAGGGNAFKVVLGTWGGAVLLTSYKNTRTPIHAVLKKIPYNNILELSLTGSIARKLQ